jgi:A/G-specific adenine glycosylase
MAGNTREAGAREDLDGLRRALLAWYEANARDLPWRRERDPYRVWLSEVMLQQTRVEAAIPYYHRFLQAYPTLASLSGAGEGQVLKLWEGLGYYARARHFLEAVKEVQAAYGGRVPEDPAVFGGLPGVGPYTRAAVLSIAYEKPLAAVDGNVKRVLSRLFCLEGEAEDAGSLQALASDLLARERPGDFNQALMDLGALLCIPGNPRCAECPLKAWCLACREGKASLIPRRRRPKEVPLEEVEALLLSREGKYLVHRRAREGLLGGLWEFPTLKPPVLPPEQVTRGEKLLVLEHRFSHRYWQVTLYAGELTGEAPEGPNWRWAAARELQDLPFPAVYHAVIAGLPCGREEP